MDIKAENEMSLVGHLTELRTRIIICLLAVALGVGISFFLAKPVLQTLTMPIEALKTEPGREQELVIQVGADGVMRVKDPREAPAKGPKSAPPTLDQLSHKRFRMDWMADKAKNFPAATLEIGEAPKQKFYYSHPLDPVMMQLKVALIMGLLFALPVLLWQIWLFVTPGLTSKERRIIKPLLVGALILFPLGAAFAFSMIKFVLMLMQTYQIHNVDPLLNIFDYLSLLCNLMLVFGFIFEIPLILAIAARIGLVTPQFLSQYRRHAYVVLSIAAMILSPGTDPITMILSLIPLVVLYELSVAISKPMARMHQREKAANEANERADASKEEVEEETNV